MTTLIVQNDDGDVANANSYVTLAYCQSYHTSRGNAFTGTDDALKAAIIKATDYLDTRFDFVGIKMGNGAKATGTLTASLNFVDGDTVTIGEQIYTFRNASSAANEVDIGVDLETSLANLAGAINGGDGVYGTGTVASDVASAVSGATTLTATAISGGTAGNSIVTTSERATWSAATLEDGGVQVTEFPRRAGSPNTFATQTLDTAGFFITPISTTDADQDTVYLTDPNGNQIIGIPTALKRACAEYALRALSAALFEDAPAPEGGRLLSVHNVSVDVISETKHYASTQSGAFVMPAYPAADLLLVRAGLVISGRVLIR